MEISPQMQNQLAQFQQLQQQIQMIATQKFQLEAKLKEINGTIEELGKIDKETPVYQSVGSILVKVSEHDKLKGELEEQKETLEVRVKTLEKQEKHLREKYQAMQQELSVAFQAMGGQNMPGATGG